MIRKTAVSLVLAAGALFSAQTLAFSGLVVFGDSLSDSGNNAALGLFDPNQVVTGNSYVPSNTYGPAGTYSNGPVWASYFAAAIGVPLAPSLAGGGNYAAGGATTGTDGSVMLPSPPFPINSFYPFSLRTQTNLYLASTGGVASADALYVVAGGGNNVRAALVDVFGGADLFTVANATASRFANDVGYIVDSLQAAGAKHIVVWNTPNVGLAPAALAGGPQAVAAGSLIAGVMNGALGARLSGEAGVTTFDVFGFGTQVTANPAAFGISNVVDACGAVAGANCSEYLYWDGIHPSTAAHALISNSMLQVVAIPEPGSMLLMAVGLAGLVTVRRRRA